MANPIRDVDLPLAEVRARMTPDDWAYVEQGLASLSPNSDDRWIAEYVRGLWVGRRRQMYIFRMIQDRLSAGSDHLTMRESRPVMAAAGTPDRPDPFRSQWERRLAAALDRLGMAWAYEPHYYNWRDWRGRVHRYTPDFQLTDFAWTYVEVKGYRGADSIDTEKMARVVRDYPNLTLLLWDADVIEYVEDVTDPTIVVGLLRTTKLAA